ncbi:MAG: hypothetical protein ACI4NM_04830 [Bullifex sp.]
MNRDARNILKRASRAFHRSVMHAVTEYRNEVGLLKNDEEEKLERLPENIRDSVKGEAISEAIELLDEVLDGTDGMEEALDDIVSGTLGYSFVNEPGLAHQTVNHADQKRDMRFQALLPGELMDRLRYRSSMTGLSMNELLIRALNSSL